MMPDESETPKGFSVVPDDEVVKYGDIVLDYCYAKGFAEIAPGSRYSELVGMSGRMARLNQLAFEVFKKEETIC